jgi:hypothetical protein
MNPNDSLTPVFSRRQQQALVAGVILLAIAVAGGFHDWTQFFRSYLVGFVFWTGVSLGCMVILMIHHLVTGTWGFALRRLLESGAKTVVLMAALAIPLMLNLSKLYSWANPAAAAGDPMPPFKRVYLSLPFYFGRTIFYFAAWIFLAYFLNKWSHEQDLTGDPGTARSLAKLSAAGLLIYGLTITYASIDWVMSLEPRWFSTIYGMVFMVTEMLAAMSLVTVCITLLAGHEPFAKIIKPQLFNDFGNLLLMLTMLWAYLSFSQYLIIWAGNVQDEIPWYLKRATGGWSWVALLLIVFHFAVPFMLLLMRFIKRRRAVLGWVAAGLLVMSFVDIFWIAMPSFEPRGPQFHWLDYAIVLGIGGVWLSLFFSQLKKRPLMALRDPRWVAMEEKAAGEAAAHG